MKLLLLTFGLSLPLAIPRLSLSADSPAAPGRKQSDYVRDASVWQTPPIRPQGFQFEIQISSLGTSYDVERVRKSIRGHNLGEYESALSPEMAAEWGYSFTHFSVLVVA